MDKKQRQAVRVKDILMSDRFRKAKRVPHHRRVSVARHSVDAARAAQKICRFLGRTGMRVNEEDVVRACLMHDLGMTEARVFKSPDFIKAFTHPRVGAKIAELEFGANEVQRNAILHHMWPLCVVPPRYPEGWIVVAADKLGTILETIDMIRRGQ